MRQGLVTLPADNASLFADPRRHWTKHHVRDEFCLALPVERTGSLSATQTFSR